MKKILVLALLVMILSPSVFAEAIDETIRAELEIEKAAESIPETLKSSEHNQITFSPSANPSENGLTPKSILKYIVNLTLSSLGEEIYFVITFIALIIISSMIRELVDGIGKGYVASSIHFAVSGIVSSLLISHVNNALASAETYVSELSVFITGLLPFLGSVALAGGEITSAAVSEALILSAVSFLQFVLEEIAVPLVRIVLSFSIVGYLSRLPLGALSELITGFATKLVTISFGVLCAIIYFQNTVTSVTDSLALRSLKLAAGNFIPLVGGFVSEASGTLISGVRLVKSTLGVFAICVILYTTALPLVNFGVRKLSLKFINVISKFVSADKESKVIGELVGIYNILSATMIASSCFFIFAISVFIKSEVG